MYIGINGGVNYKAQNKREEYVFQLDCLSMLLCQDIIFYAI